MEIVTVQHAERNSCFSQLLDKNIKCRRLNFKTVVSQESQHHRPK